MTQNSVYEVPSALITHVADQLGQPGGLPSATLKSQWRRVVDNATYGQINDLIGIKRNPNTGRLEVTYSADHTYDGGVLVALPYQFITEELAQKYIEEYAQDVEVTSFIPASGMTIAVRSGVSNLRQRAFIEASRSIAEQIGGALSVTTAGVAIYARPVYTGSGETYGIQVHQMYWLLAAIKEYTENATQYMRSALRADRVTESAPTSVRRDTTKNFEEFFNKRKSVLKADASSNTIGNLPEPSVDTITPRTWGIEVEAAGARGVRAPGDWDRKGDGSLSSAYADNSRERHAEDCPWHDHREYVYDADTGHTENPDYEDPDDCSWLEDYDEDDYGDDGGDTAEFVSPILNTAGNDDLKELLERLSREPQNASAGIHVHVDAGDLTPKQVGGLVFAYSVIEPLIESYYKRERRNYCRERDASDVIRVVRDSSQPNKVKSYRDSNGNERTMYYGDRYVSVNLCALEAHGTVEFRAMGPVYEYDHVIRWALFCREMVAAARNNTPVKVWTSIKTWRDLEKVLYKYGQELPEMALKALDFKPEAELATV